MYSNQQYLGKNWGWKRVYRKIVKVNMEPQAPREHKLGFSCHELCKKWGGDNYIFIPLCPKRGICPPIPQDLCPWVESSPTFRNDCGDTSTDFWSIAQCNTSCNLSRNVLFDQPIKIRHEASSTGSFLWWILKTKLQWLDCFFKSSFSSFGESR